ncbi:hypothetical protein JHK86_010218 [Glycine max]|nr:hypothetical protein JHK86_010218 [Glycine max]
MGEITCLCKRFAPYTKHYVQDAGIEILGANKNTYNVSDPHDLEEFHAILCDLEKADITVIQIDEAALREGLPLRKSEEAFYLNFVHSFSITNCGVEDTTQDQLHFSCSNLYK